MRIFVDIVHEKGHDNLITGLCAGVKKIPKQSPNCHVVASPQASGVTSPQTILPAGKVDSATRGFFAVVGWKDNRARSGTVPSVQSNCGDTARAWRVPNYPIRRPSVRILPETQSCVPYVLDSLVFCIPCLFRHSVTHWPC